MGHISEPSCANGDFSLVIGNSVGCHPWLMAYRREFLSSSRRRRSLIDSGNLIFTRRSLSLFLLASCPQLLRLRLALMADSDLNTRDSSSNKDLEKNHDGLTAVVPASTAVINASGHVSASQLDRSFLMQRLLRNVTLTVDVGFSYRWTSCRDSTEY